MQVGVAEVEADEDAGPVDVFDDVIEPGVGAVRVGGAAVERDLDLVGAEEGVERGDDRGRVAGVGRRVFGEVRGRPELAIN